MSANRYATIFLILIFNLNSLFAQCYENDKAFFDDSQRGWFWGESCKKKLEKDDENKTVEELATPSEPKYKISPKEVNIPWEIIDSLTRESVKQIEKESRDIAVTYPTYTNVLEHKKLQKYISDRAKEFMNQTINVTKQDFDMAQWVASLPVRSTTAINTEKEINTQKRIEIFQKYKNNMIVMAVTAKNCSFCEKQKPILKMLEEQYGVQYDTYEIDKFKDFAYAMKVERTPDMFLLFREYENDPKPKIVRIATGFHGLLDLVEAVVYGLKTIGKIKNEEVK